MKAWLTAREIAEARLPELPTTESALVRLARREGWDDHPAYARRREGRGGGLEYHVRLLPTLAQVEYEQRNMVVGSTADDEPRKSEETVSLTDRGAREMQARLAIVGEFERFARALPRLRQAAHLQVFTDKYNSGSLQVEGWVRDLIPHVSKRTILRWKQVRDEGVTAKLAVDRAKARKGTGILSIAEEGRVSTFILALLAQNAHYSAHHVRTLCLSEFGPVLRTSGGKQVAMPPVRTFQHAIKALKAANVVALTKLTNPDLYRSTMAPAGTGTMRHLMRPNQLWQIDASPIDALCVDGRHTIYACIDVFSRRAVFLVSRTPKSAAVALLLRKAILAWGVPDVVKTDNGSDFVAHDTKRLFLSLGIEMDLSDAYSPQQKGFVERVIKTFQHDFATLLPGFIGHSVADRKAIENRKSFAARLGETEAETFGVSLTGQELQALVDRWAATIYETRGHHGLKGQSPQQAYQAANFRPRMVDERALDLLLMPVAGKDGQRKVTKFGIRVDKFHYATARILPGTNVFVRRDPHDLGKIYAFAQDGSGFLGEGICAELAGIHPATMQQAVRELHAEALDEVTRPVRKILKDLARGPAPIERALRIAAENAPNVISLPKRTDQHSTPQIDAAVAAMDAIQGRVPDVGLTAEGFAEHQRLLAEHRVAAVARETAALGANVASLETPKQRYRRAVQILASVEAGTADPRDALWLGQYQQSAEYQGQLAVHQAYGDAYLG